MDNASAPTVAFWNCSVAPLDTVVPAAGVVGEAMTALTLAQGYREKFGGDHIDDAIAAYNAYRERIDWRR